MDDAEKTAKVLSGMPERVAGLKEAVEQLRVAHRDAAQLEERRIYHVRDTFEKFAQEVRERFDKVDQAHARTDASNQRVERAARGVDWKTVLAVAATVVVPIVVAILTTGGL